MATRKRLTTTVVAGALAAATALVTPIPATASTLPAATSAGRSIAPATASPTPCPSADSSNPIFSHVSGNHLIDTTGRTMVPNGMTVYGLSRHWWLNSTILDGPQIVAAATKWCVNYVRLQVSPENLEAASPYDAAFLQELEKEVHLAESWDLNVIISAQNQWDHVGKAGNPNQYTVNFWSVLAPVFAHDRRVWFDLFNEPELQPTDVWGVWRNGGVWRNNAYVGMQQLVTQVRAVAPASLIIAEPPNAGESLAGLTGYTLSGPNIAYAVHPYHEFSASQRAASFGNAAATYPVLIDEWSDWPGGDCAPAAITAIPDFLSYVSQHQIGLGLWGLIPGVLVTEATNFTPTQITSSFNCTISTAQKTIIHQNQATNGFTPVPGAQGVGHLTQSYFSTYAVNVR